MNVNFEPKTRHIKPSRDKKKHRILKQKVFSFQGTADFFTPKHLISSTLASINALLTKNHVRTPSNPINSYFSGKGRPESRESENRKLKLFKKFDDLRTKEDKRYKLGSFEGKNIPVIASAIRVKRIDVSASKVMDSRISAVSFKKKDMTQRRRLRSAIQCSKLNSSKNSIKKKRPQSGNLSIKHYKKKFKNFEEKTYKEHKNKENSTKNGNVEKSSISWFKGKEANRDPKLDSGHQNSRRLARLLDKDRKDMKNPRAQSAKKKTPSLTKIEFDKELFIFDSPKNSKVKILVQKKFEEKIKKKYKRISFQRKVSKTKRTKSKIKRKSKSPKLFKKKKKKKLVLRRKRKKPSLGDIIKIARNPLKPKGSDNGSKKGKEEAKKKSEISKKEFITIKSPRRLFYIQKYSNRPKKQVLGKRFGKKKKSENSNSLNIADNFDKMYQDGKFGGWNLVKPYGQMDCDTNWDFYNYHDKVLKPKKDSRKGRKRKKANSLNSISDFNVTF